MMRLMPQMLRALACYAAMAFTTFPALAEDAIPPSPIVKAQLVVNAPHVTKGEVIDAGVTFTMPEHWHIYWLNPGDSGIPTKLEWTLPEGLAAGDIQWPVPERIEVSGLVNYGYSREITLPVTLMPARDSIEGEVKVKASWLVCKDICIPESAMLSAPLKANPAAAKMIDTVYMDVPQIPADAAQMTYQADDKTVQLSFTGEDIRTTIHEMGDIAGAYFFPVEDGVISNNGTVTVSVEGEQLTVTMARGNAELPAVWHGTLEIHAGDYWPAYAITAKREASLMQSAPVPAAANPAPAPMANPPFTTSFLAALALAFLGGLILNIMPCVLPILALKALALAKKAQASRTAAARQGIAYTAGVVGSFLIIAGGMLVLKASGSAIGWGFQLQNAGFVAFLATVMLLVSANLLGVFELPVLFGSRATGINEDSFKGSLLTGVLAVLVATPCTAPFMATAIGATLSFGTFEALLVFATLGFGMASPFLLISLWPAARRLIPKPGAWMHRLKQFLAIPMLATAAWLVFVLVQLLNPAMEIVHSGYEPYSATRLNELREQHKPVFVDATAAWCLSCKVNERVALKPESMQQFLREKQVTMMVANWTMSDPAITQYLADFGRNGVPLYVYYPPQGEPVVLPQILTPSIVREAIDGAHE